MNQNNYLSKLSVIFYKKIFFKLLKSITHGTIEVNDRDGRYAFGHENEKNDLFATITINNPKAYRAIVFGGSVGAGGSYINGDWHTDNLQNLIRLFIKNDSLFKNIESPIARFFSLIKTINYKLKTNSIRRAKENILAHYDLGNDFLN